MWRSARRWLVLEFAPHTHAWRSWRSRPRRSLWKAQRLQIALALCVPGFLLADGARRAFNLTGSEDVLGRLIALPLVVVGLACVYLLWAYVRRPVLHEPEPDDYERKW